MIIALQTLVFFRHTLLTVLDRILRPYYKRLAFPFKNDGPTSEEDESDDQVFTEFDEERGIKFYPPMYVQRYAAVTDCLMEKRWLGKLQKVADLGYCDMSYIKYLKEIPGVQTILGVDVEKVPLRCAWDMLGCDDYPFKSDNALHVLLLQGNAADPDYRLIGCDAIVAIEMIEHMVPHDLERLVHTIFGFIKPWVAVITTPNKDFNVLFDKMGLNGMRHWDHRFEWTREQFNDWCSNIVQRYPNYQVRCAGVGPPPPGVQADVGCCTQLALFSALDYQKQQDLDPESLRVLVASPPEPEVNSVLDIGWDTPSNTAATLTPSYTLTSLTDLLPDEEQSIKIPVKLSRSTIELPMVSFRDQMLQCNLPVETEKSFMMFSDEQDYCWTRIPRRSGGGDYKVYDMEDVASRLNCTTLQVRKFSKTTQKLFANHNTDLANTKHMVEQIRHLTKMLNCNKNAPSEDSESPTTWKNINWGDNAPYWNQYYTVVREYKYPFESKSEESLILELVQDVFNRLTEAQAVGENAVGVTTLEIDMSHIMTVVHHITTDEDKVRDLLEWNGYEITGDTVIHHRTMTLPEGDSDDGIWREDGLSDWDFGTDHSDSSSMPDYCGLRRSLDRKVRKLTALRENDKDISSELDLVVCRLVKLALRMRSDCELQINPHWLQSKLCDLMSLKEMSISRRKKCASPKRRVQAIEDGTEGGRVPCVVRFKGEHNVDASVKLMEDSSLNLVQNNDDTERIVEETLHSPPLSQLNDLIPSINTSTDTIENLVEESTHSLPLTCLHDLLPSTDTSQQTDSEADTGSLATQEICVKDYAKLPPITPSTEMVPKCVNTTYSWNDGGFVSTPFLHRPPVCGKSTDDTKRMEQVVRRKSPAKRKRKDCLSGSSVIPNISQNDSDASSNVTYRVTEATFIRNDSPKHATKNKKILYNNKSKQKLNYNSLVKNYSIRLAQTNEECEMSRAPVYQPTKTLAAVKPIPCSLMELCYEELLKDNTLGHKWYQYHGMKAGDLGSEETQIMSVVMDEFAGPQDNLYIDSKVSTHKAINPVDYGVIGDYGIPNVEEDEIENSQAVFIRDLDEPSTSKGIRHENTDAQCGPDTAPMDYSLLTRTPSASIQKMYKTGIHIGDSTTDLKAEDMVDSTVIRQINNSVIYSNSGTKSVDMQHSEPNAKIMVDAPIMSQTSTKTYMHMQNNVSRSRSNINTESFYKSVSSSTSDSHMNLNVTPKTETVEKQVSAMIINETFMPLSRHIVYNKFVESLVCASDQVKDCLPDITTVFHSLYSKQYSPPKLSIIGSHVHSYRERNESEDILYQGVWKKDVMKGTPKKRSQTFSTATKLFNTRKNKSKEKLICPQLNSFSDLKNRSVVTVSTKRPTNGKDFVSQNIMMARNVSNSRTAFREKKNFAPRRDSVAKPKQNTFIKKTDRMAQLSHSIEFNKDKIVVPKVNQHVAVTRKQRINSLCKVEDVDINARKTFKAIKPDKQKVIETDTNLMFKNEIATEAKSDLSPKHLVKTLTRFPYSSKVVEMKPDCKSLNLITTDRNFNSKFESLPRNKVPSSEILTHLQDDFERKMETRILGTKAKKVAIPDCKSRNKSPSAQSRVEEKKGNATHTPNKTVINQISPNLRITKLHNTPDGSIAPNAQKKIDVKDSKHTTRPCSASPTTRPRNLATQQANKTLLKLPVRPRSAEVSAYQPPNSYGRSPIKRTLGPPKQSAETKKLTKDVLKAHNEANPGLDYLVYCSELDSRDKKDGAILYEDPDVANKYISPSSRSSSCSNCSSPNSVVTVKSQRTKPCNIRPPSVPKLALGLDQKVQGAHRVPNKKRNYGNKKENDLPPVLNLNKTVKHPKKVARYTEYNKDIAAPQSPETASPLLKMSPKERNSLSPTEPASSTKTASPTSESILKNLDEEITALKDESNVKPILSEKLRATLNRTDSPQNEVICELISRTKPSEPNKEVVKSESNVTQGVTDDIANEITIIMKNLVEDTLKGIGSLSVSPSSKKSDVAARKSCAIVPKTKKSDSSSKKCSTVGNDATEIHDHTKNTDAKQSSIKDLYERREQFTFEPISQIAMQAFSGFSMDNPPPVGDQRPDYVNLIDSETGSITTGIPTRLAASEELYVSGRSSESYHSCMVYDETIVPNWLFHISQHEDDYEDEYDDVEDHYPVSMTSGTPAQPIAVLEGAVDLNGNVVDAAPTIARTGAGDGRGIHSDQSEDSSGQGTSLSSSIDSSGPHSTVAIDSSAFPSRFDSTLESLSGVDGATSSIVRPGRPRNLEMTTPISSTERIYTLLNQAATSDVDADVSSVDTDDSVSRNQEM